MNNNLTKVEKVVIIVTVVAVFMIFGGIGYAFFTMNDNTGSTAEITNTSGKMTITYADGGSNLLVSNNIVPSDAIIANKTFTLTGLNTTTAGDGLAMEYKVGLKYTSSFSDGQIHYYIKKVSSTNEGITTEFVGEANQTVPGNETYTGYSHGTLKKGNNKYMEMVIGNFPASADSQTITFNLVMQFPDTGENQDTEKGKSLTGNIVVNYEESATDTLLAKYDTEEKTNGVSTSGLFIDNTKDVNLRYTGANPSNYVEFGNTGELWRIVGIFNVKDSEGNIARNIKIVRDSALGEYSWDATGNNNYGINDWSEADLMYELNGDYLNTSLTANKTNWYNSYWDSSTSKPVFRQTGVFDYTKTIKQKYQDMINNSVWNIGGNTYTNPSTVPYGLPLSSQYNAERGTTTYQNSRATTWTGKVGLIYAGDYGYASTNEECRNNLRAGVTYVNNTWDYSNGLCKSDNWLYKTSWYWTLSPYSGYSSDVFCVVGDGAVSNHNVSNAYNVFPAVFLKSNILIKSGKGTKTNPYKLG